MKITEGIPSAQAASPSLTGATNNITHNKVSLDTIGLIVGIAGLVLGSLVTFFILSRRRREAKKKIMPVRNLVAL